MFFVLVCVLVVSLLLVLGGDNGELAPPTNTHKNKNSAIIILPLLVVCTPAPPSCSCVTSSCVTLRTTSGPVKNMCPEPRAIKTKSVSAGE